MIYIKNTTEIQTIFIPRNELQKDAYVTSTKTYEDGYREGLEDGKEYQKDQLLNLYVTENGQYEREDGWGTVTVDIPIGDCPECEDCSVAYDEGYDKGKNDGYDSGYQDGYDQGQADCPELTTIDITENGSYEGAFNLVNVNVPQDGGECNLEDKMIAPSMGDRDGNGYIIVEEGEGYDGLSRVVIDPSTIYNEGYNQGQNDCPSEGGCNLEDKWVTPTMNDRDDNGYVIAYPSEGYDGLSRVVIDPTTIYNEGVEEGRNQGGGSRDCNIQPQKVVELDGERMGIYPDDGYDGIFEVIVEAGQKAEGWRGEGRYDVRSKLQTIEITENGRYSVDEMTEKQYIEFDGNSYFDTNIPFGENTKIEVAITKTTYEEEEQFIGVANFDLAVAETYGGFGIVAGAGLAYGVFGQAKTHNTPFSYDAEQILTLDRNGLNSSLYGGNNWIDESGLDYDGLYGQTIGIGKIKSVSDGWIYRGLNGRIRYVKIWTDGNDDSTLVTFIPKNMEQGGFGLVNSDGVEYDNISNLGEGTTTFISEWVRKYGEGWKEINVNIVPSAIEGMKFGNSTFEECPFNLERIEDFTYLFEDCKNLKTSPSIKRPIKNAHSMFSGCDSLLIAQTYNTSEATDLGGMYAGCHNLRAVGAVDCSSLPNSPIGWNREAQIFDTNQYLTLSDFGGFINLKQTVDLSGLVALADYSVESIFNNLYDFSGNGQTPNSIQGKIYMSSFITDVVEKYRTIAENKGWTVIIK